MFLNVIKVAIPVNDLVQAKDWYTRILGFKPDQVTRSSARFRGGLHELTLVSDRSRGIRMVSRAEVYWRVHKIEPAYARLIKLGATVRKTVSYERDFGLSALLVDPFGNVFGIVEERFGDISLELHDAIL